MKGKFEKEKKPLGVWKVVAIVLLILLLLILTLMQTQSFVQIQILKLK